MGSRGKTRSRSLSVTAFKRKGGKKTSTWAEVQLLASVWRFITLQRGEGGEGEKGEERRCAREQKVECRGGGSLGTVTEGSGKKGGLIVCGGKERGQTGRAEQLYTEGNQERRERRRTEGWRDGGLWGSEVKEGKMK